MHPFSIQNALLAKHAQHVVLIHFLIALFMAGVAFDFAAHWSKHQAYATVAYYNLAVAALSTLPVIATGLVAWQFQLEGQSLKGILLLRLILGITSSAMICLTWYMHFRSGRAVTQALPPYRLTMEALAVAIVAIAAHLGGFLSGVNIPS